MERTEAQIEIARPVEAVFAQVIRVPEWHRWHWDWKWTDIQAEGDGGPGTAFTSTLAVRVKDPGSGVLGAIEIAADAAQLAGALASGDTDVDIDGDYARASYHTDTYHPKLAVIEELDDAARVVFSLPWEEVDVHETYTLEATRSGCRLTCIEERGDPFFPSRFPHISLPGSRKRKLQAGLKRLAALL